MELSEIGFVPPNPTTFILFGSIPLSTRCFFTDAARRSEINLLTAKLPILSVCPRISISIFGYSLESKQFKAITEAHLNRNPYLSVCKSCSKGYIDSALKWWVTQ